MSSNEEYLDNLLKSVTGEISSEGNSDNQRQNSGEVKLPSMSELFSMEQEQVAAADFGVHNNMLSDDANLFDESEPDAEELSDSALINGLSEGINPLDIPESFEELERAVNDNAETDFINEIEPDFFNENNEPTFTDDSKNSFDEADFVEAGTGDAGINEADLKKDDFVENDIDEAGLDDLDALLDSIDKMGDSVNGAIDNEEAASSDEENETEGASANEEGLDSLSESIENAETSAEGMENAASNQEELSTVIPEDLDLENLDSILATFEDDNEDLSEDEKELSDAELNELLSSSEDDGELSEIGDLLEKNDSQEAVDASSYSIGEDDTADLDALLGDSEDSLKDADVNETREEKKERKKREKEEKKRAKKEAKEKKRNKMESDDEEEASDDTEGNSSSADTENFRIPDDINDIEELEGTLGSLGFMGDLPEDTGSEDKNKDKKKKSKEKTEKKGFFSKILDAFTEEVDDNTDELAQKAGMTAFAEETATDIAQTGAADNEKILKELGEDEPPKAKGKKKEKKKDKKKDKQKEKKSKKTKAPKEKKVDNSPVVKVPLKKIAAIMLCCISLGILICVAAIFIPYSMDMNNAVTAYDNAEYDQAFMDLTGHKLNEEEQELYNKTVILYKLDRKYESYENYMNLGMRTEALNALVQGVGAIDESRDAAYSYGITSQFELLAQKITDALSSTFAVSIDRAREWLMIDDSKEYTKALEDYTSGNEEAGSEEMMENPVIQGEEEEFSYDSGN